MTTKVLFICMGNICRSPTADGVFRKMVADAGLSKEIIVDSAGTTAGHIGAAPDKRAVAVASANGYKLKGLKARRLENEDFDTFDYVLGMDDDNLDIIRSMQTEAFQGHSGLLLEFSANSDYREIPDPYYGGTKGFELVFELVEEAAIGLLTHIKQHDL